MALDRSTQPTDNWDAVRIKIPSDIHDYRTLNIVSNHSSELDLEIFLKE